MNIDSNQCPYYVQEQWHTTVFVYLILHITSSALWDIQDSAGPIHIKYLDMALFIFASSEAKTHDP